jgi:inorganic pyrophosphatase
MNLLHDITPGKKVPNEINVIVEINKGSKNKYELDKETGLIMLDRVMFSAQDYPFDYGFVPQTHWHDGDPLDVILLTTYPLVPGLLLTARPIGVLDMIDTGEGDAKIIAVPVKDARWKNVKDITDVNPHTIEEIRHFLETYKILEKKEVTIPTARGAKEAMEVIEESIELYKKEFNKN